ncbi:uncharacterized protein LOC122662885 [Telopea speciosissima]|uniref:uncharacterized protein LOC122662885 n=1 Tax=Telopea speciosissima TaxID=54955 RepID=UPI001CC3DFA6|nr:uncharacterized protein LOC122662885 [Telopea speciosissima]
MEKAFKFLGCTEEQKLTCAGYELQSEAEAWWETNRPILEAAHPVLTWEIFKQAFFGNYFPTSVRKKKEIELAELTQGPRSVLEYQQKFEELFFFAPPHLNTDEAKAQKFEDGLRPQIASIMTTRTTQGYSEVVQLAKRVEDKQRDAYQVNQGLGKRSVPFGDREYKKFSKPSYYSSAPSQSQKSDSKSSAPRPVYANPTIRAIEASIPAANQEAKCYNYGQAGHFSRSCYNQRPILPYRQQGNQPQGRVIFVSADDARANQTVAIGITLVYASLVYSLFDIMHVYTLSPYHIGTILVCLSPAYALFDTHRVSDRTKHGIWTMFSKDFWPGDDCPFNSA